MQPLDSYQVKGQETLLFAIMPNSCAPVAQLDRVLVSEAKGRGFDSRRAHQSDIEVGTCYR